MDENEKDAELIRRVAARDTRAMDALFNRYTTAIYPIAARILRDGSEAEDVVQDSWLQIWRDAAAYDARRGTVEAWLHSMVRSRALDRAAALAARRQGTSQMSGPEAEAVSSEDDSSAPIGAPSPALKGRVMATIQAGGAEVALQRSLAAERALAAVEPPREAEAPRETGPSHIDVGWISAPQPTAPAAHAAPHFERAREAEPEPIPPPHHEVPVRESRRGFGWVWSVGWGLATIFAIVAGTLLESTGRLRAIISARNHEVNELHRRVAVEEKWGAMLGFPGAQLVSLVPTPDTRTTVTGRAIYAPAAQRALLVLEGATPPAGSDYEVWVLRAGGLASQGVATPDARGIAVLRLESIGEVGTVSGFAVSLEAKGGSPIRSTPSGPFVVTGSIAN